MAGFSDLDNPLNTKAVSAAYTLSNTDMTVMATASGAYAVTLPALANVPNGHTVLIAKDGGANAITVTPAGSDKINNIAANFSLASGGTNGHSVTLMSISSTWLVVGSV
jgi:hypothetical protein